MSAFNTDLIVAVYDWHSNVERAVLALHDAGCNMKRISLVGRNGAYWGRLPGMLADSAAEFIPANGFTLVPGKLAATTGDAASVADALAALGFPRKAVAQFETALKANDFILVDHGDEQEAYRARELLETSGFVTLNHFRVGEETTKPA